MTQNDHYGSEENDMSAEVPQNVSAEVDESKGAGSPFVLQEMWSLQQEVLREILSGFRRLEASQLDVQKKLEEREAAEPNKDFLEMLEKRFESVEEAVSRLDSSLRGVLGESDASLQSQLEETQKTLRDAVEPLQNELHETKAAVQKKVEHAVNDLKVLVDGSRENSEAQLAEVRSSLQEIVSRAIDEHRNQSMQSMGRILEEIQQVQAVRNQVESALKELTREVRDVAAIGGRLESSTVLTQELLDEQRRVSEDVGKRQAQEDARRFNNAGVLCYHQGAYDSSVENFLKAIECDESLAEAHNNLGLSYTEMGREEEATKEFQRALELDPTVGQAYSNLGYLYYKRGDFEDAIEMYERATQRSSDTSAAYTNLGNALYKMDRVEESVKAWRRALEVDPGNSKAAAALERLGLETQS